MRNFLFLLLLIVPINPIFTSAAREGFHQYFRLEKAASTGDKNAHHLQHVYYQVNYTALRSVESENRKAGGPHSYPFHDPAGCSPVKPADLSPSALLENVQDQIADNIDLAEFRIVYV
jgi:hypothetical protein